MDNTTSENKRFLENIFRKGPFEGHAAVCKPAGQGAWLNLGDYTLSERPVTDWIPGLVQDYERQQAFHSLDGNRLVPTVHLGTATHIYAAAFGCEVHEYEDSNPCALPFVSNAAEADAIEEPDIWSSPTLYRVFELARAVLDECGPETPLGPPDLQSGFDSASLVWNKEDFLCAMLLEPDAAMRLVDKCARLFKQFLVELRREFPTLSPGHCPRTWVPPDLGPWLSNDECGAFGVNEFETFCLPELVDLAETFGGLGMHCCADAEHQFESFKKIPNFYAFNRVKGKLGWDPLLEHFDGPDAPVHVLGWVGPEQAERFVRQAHPDTRFIFVHNAATADDAKEWLGKMDQILEPVPA